MEYNKTWLRRRTLTFVAFCIISFTIGCEFGMINPTLLFYFEHFIGTEHPNLFFGLTASAYALGSIIGTLFIGKYADKSRNVRRIMLISILCGITGNIIYAIYLSPFCPVIGRFISGLTDVVNMVMISEIARSYEDDEVTERIAWIVNSLSIGLTASPGFNFFYYKIDINIGNFHIAYGNAPAIILAVMFMLLFVIVHLMVSDLSKEFDLKEETNTLLNKGTTESNKENVEKSKIDKKENNIANVKFLQIVMYPDVFLLMCLSFFGGFILFTLEICMPLMASHYFGLGVKFTSLVGLFSGIVYMVFLVGLGKVSKRVTDYHMILGILIVMFLGLLSVLALSINHSDRIVDFILFGIFLIAIFTSWCIEEVLTRSLLSKFIPSRCQGTAEGYRRSVSCIAFIISGVTSAALFPYLEYLTSVLCIIYVVLFAVFLLRRKSMISPRVLFQ